ncbi:response regulator [Spirosoma endbachense]|uniref:response regulator n=1 Tax=Spirosoma endbachense TaxID=2666025 RepID=UPI001E5434C9|nr:response regulator transcription factor [Spirosoma endbachense]
MMRTNTRISTARLLLVDDHQIVLDSLQLLFREMPGVEVVGTLSDSRKVITFVDTNDVDILICDLHMPRQSGLELTMALRLRHPDLKILILTMAEDATAIREAVRAGVSGYVLKRTGRNELQWAIDQLMNEGHYFSPELVGQLASFNTNGSNPIDELAILTDREIEVLTLIADERSTQQIADRLFISVPTVETHRRHLMQKLGAKSVVGMVKFAMKHGLAH